MNNVDISNNISSQLNWNREISNNIFDIILSELAYARQYQTALNNSVNDTNMYEKVISKIGLKQLKKRRFKKYLYKDQLTCPITMEKFKDGEKITQLPCSHIFKKDAIYEWVYNNKPTCPVCRYELHTFERLKKQSKEPFNINTFNNNHNNGDFLSQPIHNYSLIDSVVNEYENNLELEHVYSTLLNTFFNQR